jgi:uncharacterized repeat protein (TIGR03803 family)
MRLIRSCACAAVTCGLAASLASCAGGSRTLPQRYAVRPALTGRLQPATGTFKVLHDFSGSPDGAQPYAALIDVSGTLYSTTKFGGMNDAGSIFKITPSGTENILYSFATHGGGDNPNQPVLDVNGTLYGTTQFSFGGTDNCGTVFSATPAGGFVVLRLFAANSSTDACQPSTPLVNVNGTFYGASSSGGKNEAGALYSITKAGSEKVLHSFLAPGPATPLGRLANVNGTLYGVTVAGGPSNVGTVYSATLTGTVKDLHNFAGGNDGSSPLGGLVNVNGTLYGTTAEGGTHGLGTVFSITTLGVYKVLYNFGSKTADASAPEAALIDVGGTLYGTTHLGGTSDVGTIFKISTAGSETVMHSFDTTAGRYPAAPLLNVGGTLYGTTVSGGLNSDGVVFSFVP